MAGDKCGAVNNLHHTENMELFFFSILENALFRPFKTRLKIFTYLILVEKNLAPHGKKTKCRPCFIRYKGIFTQTGVRYIDFYCILCNPEIFRFDYSIALTRIK